MKNYLIIIVSIFLLLNCGENKKTINDKKVEIIDTIKYDVDSNKVEQDSLIIDTIDYSDSTNVPCKELREFANEIEKLGWIPDPIRLKKKGMYEEIDPNNIKYFNNIPFYEIKFEETKIYRYSSKPKLSDNIFKGVKSIWGYFYRESKQSDLISDGVIEQWEYESEIIAEKAISQFRNSLLDFNTIPYFCRIRNFVFVFQTRAMKFSFDQKAVYEIFVNEKINNL